MKESNIKSLLIPLKIIGICFILICIVTFLDNTYFAVKRDNKALREQLSQQEVQVEELTILAEDLSEQINELISKQSELTERVGIDEEGIGGPSDEDVLSKTIELQGKIAEVTESLNDVQASISNAEGTLVVVEEKVVEQEAIPDSYPVKDAPIGSYYGYREDPISGETRIHTAIDITAPRGTPIYAAGSGTVITAGYADSYGYVIIIDHGNGYKSLYAHCSELFVEVAQVVVKGEEIAAVGATGYATGNHLHFSILLNDKFINPLKIIK